MAFVQPIDFRIDVPQPNLAPYLEMRAVNMANIQKAALQAGQTFAGLAQQQQAMQAQQAMQERYRALSSDFINAAPEEKANRFAALVLEFPGAEKQIKAAHDAMDADFRKAQLDVVNPLVGLISNGRVDLAKDMITKRIEGLKNAGRPGYESQVKNLEGMLSSLDTEGGPNAVLNSLVARQAQLMDMSDPSKWAETQSMMVATQKKAMAQALLEEEKAKQESLATPYFVDKLKADLKLTTAQALKANADAIKTAESFNLDSIKHRDEMALKWAELTQEAPDKNLAAPDRERINKYVDNASAFKGTADNYMALADQLDAIPSGVTTEGFLAGWKEKAKQILGAEDPNSLVLNTYEQIKNAGALEKLRGTGSVSNFELTTFLKGWPGSNAKRETIAAFLRGMAKASRFTSVINDAKATWSWNNGGTLGPARARMVVSGVVVEPGDTYLDFESKYAQRLTAEYFPDNRLQRAAAAGLIDETSYENTGAGQSMVE